MIEKIYKKTFDYIKKYKLRIEYGIDKWHVSFYDNNSEIDDEYFFKESKNINDAVELIVNEIDENNKEKIELENICLIKEYEVKIYNSLSRDTQSRIKIAALNFCDKEYPIGDGPPIASTSPKVQDEIIKILYKEGLAKKEDALINI